LISAEEAFGVTFSMATTLKEEVTKILRVAGIEVENPVLSCNEGNPSRTDDDTCQIDQIDWSKSLSSNAQEAQAAHHPTNVRVDDIFTMANTRNLARHAPPDMDHNNYFFRVDPNAVFYRRGSVEKGDLGDGGMLFRTPGSLEWQQLDVTAIAASPALKAAVVPLLLRLIGSRSEYDRLNGKPHHGDDYGYAQAKAVVWLNKLIPEGDAGYREALLRAFPAMSEDAQFFTWYRFQSEKRESEIAPALTALLSNPERRDMARGLLHRHVLPDVPVEDLSNESTLRWRFAWNMSGGVYVPLPLRTAPDNVSWRGETEPVGSYISAGIGAEAFIGPRVDVARRLGPRFGAEVEVSRVLNGFGFYSFDLRLLAGTTIAGVTDLTGYLEGGLNLYPTGGFMGEGNYGDIILHPNAGAGLWLVPHRKYFPLGITVGARMNPTEPNDVALQFGLGGHQ
jgi:hypothetical protein